MKILQISYIIGCISLIIASAFRIIYLIKGSMIFNILPVPFYCIGIIGFICGVVWTIKKKRACKNEQEKL